MKGRDQLSRLRGVCWHGMDIIIIDLLLDHALIVFGAVQWNRRSTILLK